MINFPPYRKRSGADRGSRGARRRLRAVAGWGGVFGGAWHLASSIIGNSSAPGSLFRRLCSVGELADGIDAMLSLGREAVGTVAGLFGGILGLFGGFVDAALPTVGMCALTAITLALVAVLRQARVHLVVANLEGMLAELPGDRCVHVSPGIALTRVFYLAADGRCCSQQRLWHVIRQESWRGDLHPISLGRRFVPKSVGAASVHDLRRYLRHARHSWLSREEIALLVDVQKRVYDSLVFRDRAGDGDDDGGGGDDGPPLWAGPRNGNRRTQEIV